MEELKDIIWNNIETLRRRKPLVYNITNIVSAGCTANALLAAGASPVMSCAEEEAAELAGMADALVLNIGTADRNQLALMSLALKEAHKRHIPTILDPVGAGATAFRTGAARQLLDTGRIRFLRGNISEMMALAEFDIVTRGVDTSSTDTANALLAARELSARYNCAVSVSGPTDIITCRNSAGFVSNGSDLMPLVTGLGCSASALLGAFAAVDSNPLHAAVSAAAFLAVCGELAAQKADGPGTLAVHLPDIMHGIDETTFKATCRVRCTMNPTLA